MAQAWRNPRRPGRADRGDATAAAREEPFAGEQVSDAPARGRRRRARRRKAVGASRGESGEVTVELEGGDDAERRGAAGRGRPPAAHRRGSASRRSGVEAGRWLEVDDRLRVGGPTGSTRSATSTAARCSPTWASTRRGSPPTAILGQRRRRDADGQARRGSRSPTRRSPRSATRWPGAEAGLDARAVDVETSATAGASFHGRNMPGTTRIVVDEERRVLVGATFVGPETAELPARGDHRGRRRGAAGAPLARGARVPHAQRGLAQADGELRALKPCSERQLLLQLGEDVAREADDLVELVKRLEAAQAIAVGKHPARLCDRQLQAAQLVVGGLVEVELASGGRRGWGGGRRGPGRRSEVGGRLGRRRG